ncbi:MAG: DUF3592 domain-containing protein [Candidatus Krumholzibacteria bacterium]|nr:DUF3592 domain-containing protein [Candidatus Krumholzibacteria bacterium]
MTTEEAVPKNAKGNAAILIIALVIFGLVFGGFGLRRYNIGKESGNWPTVKGKVTYTHADSRRVNSKQEYQATVKYTYTVDGKSYTGKRITASDVYQKSLSGANDIIDKYPVGGEVSVYYDPADPGTALLDAGMKKNVYLMLGGGLACFFLAGAIIASELKKKRMTAG